MTLTFAQVVFDCRDALSQAQFWSVVLEHPVDAGASPYFASIGRAADNKLPTAWMFIQVPEDRVGKNRLHVDLVSAAPTVDIDRALQAGAERVADFDEYGTAWTTLHDPEGNVFDIGRGLGAGD